MSAEGLRDEVRELVREALEGGERDPRAQQTVAEYAAVFLSQQRQRHLVAVDSDEARLRLHVLPFIGARMMGQVRPRHIREMILAHREAGKLSPRSIRHVFTVTSSLFKSAIADEVLTANPCVVRRGDLPPCVDRDPAWRAGAVFTRREVEALLFDPALIHWRRMMYGLKFLAALRHSEAANLRWNQIEARDPLPAILLSKTKARKPRVIPVHPALAWMLSDWQHNGFPELMGRAPQPLDLVVGTTHNTPRARNNCQRALLADLAHLGWRKRRGHDLRRTFVTLARADGARDEILRAISHGPRQDVQEQYTSWPYASLCAEMVKLQIGAGRGVQLDLFSGWATGLEPAASGATVPTCSPGGNDPGVIDPADVADELLLTHRRNK